MISASGLGKCYKAYSHPSARLVEWLSRGRTVRHQESWVLRNLTFSVGDGEAVAFIGQNGAGKSTLLKILAGTTSPTEGTYSIGGRVSALLELGLGFHADFSGRQNAQLGLQIQGAGAADLPALVEAVKSFSELGDYFDKPLRVYSSGMQMRLAFSVASAQRPDVLIVDEAMAVGDAYFQHKCIRRIRDFLKQGTTLLFVSHDAVAVKSLCSRGILIENGVIVRDGGAAEVMDYYNAIIARKEKDLDIRQAEDAFGQTVTRSGNRRAVIAAVDLRDAAGTSVRALAPGETCDVVVDVDYHEPVEDGTVGIAISDRLGNHVFGTNTNYHRVRLPCRTGRLRVRFRLQANLGPGDYGLVVASHTGDSHLADSHDWWERALAFRVVPDAGPPFIGTSFLPTTIGIELAGGDREPAT